MSIIMPDIANQVSAQTEGTLDWVGMSNIEMPLLVQASNEAPRQVSAKIEAFVNLVQAQAKGIHMSRLYLLLDQLATEDSLSFQSLKSLLDGFISSHDDLSTQAHVKLAFDYHLRRESLISKKLGWKAYPVTLTGRMHQGKVTVELAVEVPYSSTCPCSAALARQLIQQSFDQHFSQQQIDRETIRAWLGTTEGIVATPHSQRSAAQVKVLLNDTISELPIVELVNAIEQALQTPVQAAVKREDEQEFARLNGQNLMFCEDAARRLKFALNHQSFVNDFWLRVNHYESLHAHDAVSVATKGIVNGYTA